MSFLKSILQPFKWLLNKISLGVKAEAPIAVTITEAVKTILANPGTGLLENIIDSVTGTPIAVDAANLINAAIPKILAAELTIEVLPDTPTATQVLAFEQRVLAAFNVSADNSRLYTVLGAEIYGIINTQAQSGKPLTFATLVADIEQVYNDYKADLAANVAPVVTTKTVTADPQ